MASVAIWGASATFAGMAYAPPSKADFLARFPSFSAVTDPTYTLWSEDAAVITGAQEDCLGGRIDLATMYLTAHYLTMAGIGTGTDAQMAAAGASDFKRIRSGSLDLERGESKQSDGGTFATTTYGREFWSMIRPCLTGPRVTGTGVVIGGCGFNGFAGPLPPWQC